METKSRIEYQVWQGGEWQAASDDYGDALHYAHEYAKDGPVLVYEVKITEAFDLLEAVLS